jgi:hypothetical protein
VCQSHAPSHEAVTVAYNVPREFDLEKGRLDMGGRIDISGYGKLSIAPKKDAKLLVVFGGIPVGGKVSGVYMWDFMGDIIDRFHIFVAVSSDVDGDKAYDALMSTVQAQGLTPSQQILYLFSGGYKPGMGLLSNKSPSLFSSIFLVDIWMGATQKSGSRVPDFYKALVNSNTAQITYVYTSFGANNEAARDYIANKLGGQKATLVRGQSHEEGMQTHLRTNTVAISKLPRNGQTHP